MGISNRRTAIMGICAVWVWYTHTASALLTHAPFPFAQIERYIGRMGSCAVDMFVLLSGFGIYYSLEKIRERGETGGGALLRFYGQRVWRIYRVFLPITVVIALANGWTLPRFISLATGWGELTENLYMHQWYIWCILIFYLIAPLLYRVYRASEQKTLLTLSAVIIESVAVYLLCGHIREDFFLIIARLPIFQLGMHLAYIEREGLWQPKRDLPMLIIAMFAGIVFTWELIIAELPLPIILQFIPGNLLTAPGLAVLLALLLGKLKKSNIILRVLEFYGAMSLEFYCWHEFVDEKVLELVQIEGALHNVIPDIVSFTVSTVLAYLTYRAVNKS